MIITFLELSGSSWRFIGPFKSESFASAKYHFTALRATLESFPKQTGERVTDYHHQAHMMQIEGRA